MRYFPLFTDLEQAHVLVVGGGEQAAQKVRLLRKTSAHITVVAESVSTSWRARGDRRPLDRSAHLPAARPRGPAPRLRRHRRPPARCRRFRAAKARGIPVNVVDAPALSTFIMPAIVDRAPVTVAIGTEGAAPVLAREIKTLLETLLPANSARWPGAPRACATPSPRPSPIRAPAAACGSGCCKVPSAAPSSVARRTRPAASSPPSSMARIGRPTSRAAAAWR